ncbi:MAG: cytochrome c biogenesis protein CcsA [Phycisphaeraceae bacterium]
MSNLPTTIALGILTLLSVTATIIAWRSLRPSQQGKASHRVTMSLLGTVTTGSAVLFVIRWWAGGRWAPLDAHVDGLLLIAALLGVLTLFLRSRAHLPGLTTFALPLISFVLLWGICASQWTFHGFHIISVWSSLHLASVYVGTALFVIAAVAGVMYLYAERRLRSHSGAMPAQRVGSLEAIEKLIIRTSAIGFALLTVALITGFVMWSTEAQKLAPGWWYSRKIVLALVAWLIYAVVMNVRHTTAFRGSRAAWLSIIGLVLLLGVWMVSVSLPLTAAPAGLKSPTPAGTAYARRESP